jgi:hypothetical protein
MSQPAMPGRCPTCGGRLEVEKLHCAGCGTDVQGRFRACPVCALDPDTRRFFDLFLQARGNLKEVQRTLGLSYPTVRQRSEEMFEKLEGRREAPDASKILERVRRGELSVAEAERLLRGT